MGHPSPALLALNSSIPTFSQRHWISQTGRHLRRPASCPEVDPEIRPSCSRSSSQVWEISRDPQPPCKTCSGLHSDFFPPYLKSEPSLFRFMTIVFSPPARRFHKMPGSPLSINSPQGQAGCRREPRSHLLARLSLPSSLSLSSEGRVTHRYGDGQILQGSLLER